MGNARIVAPIAETIGVVAPDTKILVVTNPVDVMTSVALKYSKLKPTQVFGLGTHLDSMRLKSLIASYFHVHVSEVHTRIIGEHGDSLVPLWSATTIGGIKISNLPEFAHLPGPGDHRIGEMQRPADHPEQGLNRVRARGSDCIPCQDRVVR